MRAPVFDKRARLWLGCCGSGDGGRSKEKRGEREKKKKILMSKTQSVKEKVVCTQTDGHMHAHMRRSSSFSEYSLTDSLPAADLLIFSLLLFKPDSVPLSLSAAASVTRLDCRANIERISLLLLLLPRFPVKGT